MDTKEYYQIHKEKIKESSRKYRQTHKNKLHEYYLVHKEQMKEYDNKYRLTHKDEKKKYGKQYYLENKNKIKQYYLENKDKIIEYSKEYYESHKEKINEYKRELRKFNRGEKVCQLCGKELIGNAKKYCEDCGIIRSNECGEQYRKKHKKEKKIIKISCKKCGKEIIKSGSQQKYCNECSYKNIIKSRRINNKKSSERRLKTVERLGSKCCICGNEDKRVLQIDHINGNGVQETKTFGGPTYFYDYLLTLSEKELKSKYQLLCANCNWIKKYENNEVYKGVKEI